MKEKFSNTKAKIAQFFYNKIQKGSKRSKIDKFELESVKSIGIIFDENSLDVNDFIKEISIELKDNKRRVSIYELGYNIEEDAKPLSNGFPTVYFTNNDVNYYGKPKLKDVVNFIEEPFDLLINLASNDSWAIRFSAILSNASFKVGDYDANSDVYDLMIVRSSTNKSSEFYDLILRYLRIINR